MPDPSPAPPGSFVELNLDLIGEGSFRKKFERALRRAFRELRNYQDETGGSDGSAVVTATVKINRTKNTQDHYDVVHGVSVKTPTAKELSIIKARNDRLLCQPGGANGHDPDQMAFYDAQGRVIGGVDPDTGEAAGDVAGRIPRAAGGGGGA